MELFMPLHIVFKNQIPFVNVDRGIVGIDCHQILLDDQKGAYQATQHLIDIGCRRIAHIAGPKEALNSHNRQKGYEQCLRANGLSPEASLISYSDFCLRNSAESVKQVFSQATLPEGIFAVNDEMAMGCIDMAIQKGIKIPDELAIVGFDNAAYGPFFRPSISTVKSPIREMGQMAARHCLQQINNYDAHTPQTQLLSPELIIRETSRRGYPKHYA